MHRNMKESPDQGLSPNARHSKNVTHGTPKLHSFFSLHSRDTKRRKKQEILHFSVMLVLTHIVSDAHKHTSRPVRLRVGLSAAYNALLENAVLPVFSLEVSAMCV